MFAQNIGIAFTGFDTLDDLCGDGLSYVIAAVSDPQRDADNLECETEDALGLRVEARTLVAAERCRLGACTASDLIGCAFPDAR